MAITKCKYKKDTNKIMSGSGIPGAFRQKVTIATTSPKKKQTAKKVAKYTALTATGLIVPYYALYRPSKYIVKNIGYDKKTDNGKGPTYKEEYGLKNKSHVEKARKAIQGYDIELRKYENWKNWADSILHPKIIGTASAKQVEKAKLLLKYIKAKTAHADYRSQKIINYITKQGKNNALPPQNNKTSATDRLREYIMHIKRTEII